MSSINMGLRPTIVASSGTAASVTGTTSETQLAPITIPAGLLKANDKLRISTLWSYTNSANNKTPRIRFSGAGGAAIMAINVTKTTALVDQRVVHANNATNPQKTTPWTLAGGFGTTTAAPSTTAVDTTVPGTLYISGQLALGSETLTLEAYTVEHIPGA
jgi:hypothetical protein